RPGAVMAGIPPCQSGRSRNAVHRRSSFRWRSTPDRTWPARTKPYGNIRPGPQPSTVVSRLEVFLLVPFQASSAPHIAIGNEHRHHEDAHLNETEPAKLIEFNRKGVQEDDLDI